MSKNEERDRVLRSENEEGKDEVEAHRFREGTRERKTEAPNEERDEQGDDFEAHVKQE